MSICRARPSPWRCYPTCSGAERASTVAGHRDPCLVALALSGSLLTVLSQRTEVGLDGETCVLHRLVHCLAAAPATGERRNARPVATLFGRVYQYRVIYLACHCVLTHYSSSPANCSTVRSASFSASFSLPILTSPVVRSVMMRPFGIFRLTWSPFPARYCPPARSKARNASPARTLRGVRVTVVHCTACGQRVSIATQT